MSSALRGAVPSPNIWRNPQVYEVQNRAVDPEGALAAAMRSLRDWQGADVVDIGCGTGFHLPLFARTARRVIGVEPHTSLARSAGQRVAGLTNTEVRRGLAQHLPVPDASVDVAHARWAYFFGPGCEPGLAELRRVMRRGGVAFVIDNDATRSTFGTWFRRSLPGHDPRVVERFWSMNGFQRHPVDIRWRFDSREDFEAVLHIEFPPELAADIAASHPGLTVDYAVNLWWRRYS